MYTLDAVVVEADRTKNKFGDTITEQSYYRTGGDVKVITREEIEKRHYTDLTEAIKRVPGVTFQRPGYRGGEYGYSAFNNGVAINGDFRVIILVDGRRVDNSTSTRNGDTSYGSNKGTGVNLDEVTNIDNVDKIEVIKGPGASAYGSDAMGGVINIITRRGGEQPTGTVDLSTGSVDQHNYSVTYSGSAGNDNSLHYFISANRTMSGDIEYRDGWYNDQKGTLSGSRYKDNGVNIRVDKDFGNEHSLKIWYNHKDGWDGYPIATPNLKYYNEADWKKIAFQTTTGVLDKDALANGVYKLSGKDKPTQKYKYNWDTGKYEYVFDEKGNPVWNEIQGKDGKWYTGLGWTNDETLPGYHNLFMTDSGIYGSYNEYRNNDLDIVYTFNKDNGMESFIRYYDQDHYYAGNDDYKWGYLIGPDGKPLITSSKLNELTQDFLNRFPNGATQEEFNKWTDEHTVPFPEGDSGKISDWLNKTGGKAGKPDSWHQEKNRGFQLQYAKSLGIHDVITSVTYDKAKTYSFSTNNDGTVNSSHVQRKTVRTYVQDKIHLTDKWDFTPALRYTWYSSYENSLSNGTHNTVKNSDDSSFDYTLNTEYMFNDSTSMYFGWTRIYRPIKAGDYTADINTAPYPLQSEKGNAWTLGIRKDLTENMTLSINYDWTKMSNAIANLPIYDANGNQSNLAMNASEDKQSFNITLDSKIGDHWTISAAYDHMKDDWKAKNGITLPDNWQSLAGSDVNTGINNSNFAP